MELGELYIHGSKIAFVLVVGKRKSMFHDDEIITCFHSEFGMMNFRKSTLLSFWSQCENFYEVVGGSEI